MAQPSRTERDRQRRASGPIGWDRVQAIFDDPRPPRVVTEAQFDYGGAQLEELARTPHSQIDFPDLWFYYHDLASVRPLQPDLFDYLFPACLMHWHVTMMHNQGCGCGDIEFHDALRRGLILDSMVTAERRDEIFAFWRDSWLQRLDAERGFTGPLVDAAGSGWLGRFNSLGIIMPRIDLLWEPWWAVATPGRALAVLKYCGWLMYLGDEHPLYQQMRQQRNADAPFLFMNDSQIYRDHAGWLPENLAYLTATLTPDFVADRVVGAVARLAGRPEHEQARQFERDLPQSRDRIAQRIADLPIRLARRTRPDGIW